MFGDTWVPFPNPLSRSGESYNPGPRLIGKVGSLEKSLNLMEVKSYRGFLLYFLHRRGENL